MSRGECILLPKLVASLMGGHSAWRKRVASGELAKGRGGAIARHRPRWGRKGEDLKLNRKGNIAGGNPKRKNTRRREKEGEDETSCTKCATIVSKVKLTLVLVMTITFSAAFSAYIRSILTDL